MEITIIILAAIIVALAIGLFVTWRKLSETKLKLSNANRELSEHESFMNLGSPLFSIEKYSNNISVFNRYWTGERVIKLTLKRYFFTDPDSRDYAIRCAEELIEKLEEKI